MYLLAKFCKLSQFDDNCVFLLVLVKMVFLYKNGVFSLECSNVSKLVENSLYKLLFVTVKQFEEKQTIFNTFGIFTHVRQNILSSSSEATCTIITRLVS